MIISIESKKYTEHCVNVLEKIVGKKCKFFSCGSNANQDEEDMELTFSINKRDLNKIQTSLPKWAKLVKDDVS